MGYWPERVDFSTLVGLTLANITHDEDSMIFSTTCGKVFKLYHEQDCCEHVSIEDITGDLYDLIDSPILIAEEATSNGNYDDSYGYTNYATWTFYKLATRKGYVDIRWYGSSNGYYSERVDFVDITDEFDDEEEGD